MNLCIFEFWGNIQFYLGIILFILIIIWYINLTIKIFK